MIHVEKKDIEIFELFDKRPATKRQIQYMKNLNIEFKPDICVTVASVKIKKKRLEIAKGLKGSGSPFALFLGIKPKVKNYPSLCKSGHNTK